MQIYLMQHPELAPAMMGQAQQLRRAEAAAGPGRRSEKGRPERLF